MMFQGILPSFSKKPYILVIFQGGPELLFTPSGIYDYIHTLSLQAAFEEEKVVCFAIIVLQMYCYHKCSVALPHCAMGWSAVCDCGVS